MEERVVTSKEDVSWALKTLRNGETVFCHPSMRGFLEYEVRRVGLKVAVIDDVFGYEFVPLGGEQ